MWGCVYSTPMVKLETWTEEEISVTKATEHCSCNSHHSKNYIADERFDKEGG